MNPAFVIVLGLSPTGLYLARELAGEGIDVMGIDSEKRCGYYSNSLSLGHLIAAADRELCHLINQLCLDKQRHCVLMPSSDTYIEWLVQHSAQFSERVHFQTSYRPATYATLVDKAGLAELCRTHGVSIPFSRVIDTAELSSIAPEINYPCLLKPVEIHRVAKAMRGRKVLTACNEEELRCLEREASLIAPSWLLQEMVPGPESNITLFGAYFASDGSAQQCFSARKLRQYPPGFGSASLVEGEVLEETRDISISLLQAIGFTGIAGTEFKRDPRDNKLKLIEINPRPTLWFGASHSAGMRIALAAYADISGDLPLPTSTHQKQVLWRYGLKDIYSALFYRFRAHSLPLPPPDLSANQLSVEKSWPVANRHDMLPLWGECVTYLRKLGPRL